MKEDKQEMLSLLNKAEQNGLFEDLICSKCESTNDIDWRNQKINHSGVLYNCKNCNLLDIVGWDIIKEKANEAQ